MIIKLWRTQRGPERTLNLINNNSTETKKKQKESGFLSRIEGYGVKVFECEGKHYGYTGDIQSGWIPDPGFVKHWNVFQILVSISKLVTFSVSWQAGVSGSYNSDHHGIQLPETQEGWQALAVGPVLRLITPWTVIIGTHSCAKSRFFFFSCFHWRGVLYPTNVTRFN